MINTKSEFSNLIPPLQPEEYILLEESIKNEGLRDPILVWNNIIIDGHNRFQICNKYKIKYHTKDIKFDSEDEAKLWIIKNQLSRRNLNQSQKAILGSEYKKVYVKLYPVGRKKALMPTLNKQTRDKAGEIAGVSARYIDLVDEIKEKKPERIEDIKAGDIFITEVIKEIKEDEKAERKQEVDNIKEAKQKKVQLKYKIKPGDIYILGNHRLMCGDSTKKEDLNKLMNKKIASITLTDPPYNLGYEYRSYKDNKTLKEYSKMSTEWFNLTKQFSKIQIITVGVQNLHMWMGIEKPQWTMCWFKPNAQSGCKLRGLNKWEPILVYFKDKLNRIIPWDTYQVDTGYLSDKDDGMREVHACPKPTKLFGKIIQDFTNKNDIVLDVFGGSGTSIIVCEQLKRSCYMMETDPFYCSLIIERWEDLTKNSAILTKN